MGIDRLLIAGQPLVFQIIADGEFVRLALGILVRHAGDHAQFVQCFVGVGLHLGLRIVGLDRGRARLLVHQVALHLHALALELGLGGLPLQVRVHRRLLHLRITHLQNDRVRFHDRSRQYANAHYGRFGFRGNLQHGFL